MKRVKIQIPTKNDAILELAGTIKDKHTKLGKNSPLLGVDWKTFGPSVDQAIELNNQANEAHRRGEQFTEQRDKLMTDVVDCVRSCRDVLLGLNRRNPRALTDFDFIVSDAAAAKTKNGNGDENDSSQAKA